MYDIDPQRPALRLGDTPARVSSYEEAAKRLTIAEHEMEEAIKRWSAAFIDWTALRAQSRPVSAVRHPVGDGAVRYEPAPTVFRFNGHVERL